MDYEQFSQDVTTTTAAKRTVDKFAKMQVDGVHICPRCGRLTVKERLTTNALSRDTDVYICDACGMDEAVRNMKGDTLPLKDWAIARVPQQARKGRWSPVKVNRCPAPEVTRAERRIYAYKGHQNSGAVRNPGAVQGV